MTLFRDSRMPMAQDGEAPLLTEDDVRRIVREELEAMRRSLTVDVAKDIAQGVTAALNRTGRAA